MSTVSEIEIIDDIELPARTGGGGMAKYPWRNLEIGQGFFVAGVQAKSLAPCAHGFSRKHPELGLRFSVRNMEKDGERGVGVKRIALKEAKDTLVNNNTSANGDTGKDVVPAKRRFKKHKS